MNTGTVTISDRDLYKTLWERADYRDYSPGEACVQTFLAQARPKPLAPVIDFGCGTGRAGLLLAVLGQLDVTMVDFVGNCLDTDIRPMLETQAHTLRFLETDLLYPLPVNAPYGFCCDLMEHFSPEDVDRVLDNVLHAAQHVFFQVSTEPDDFGRAVGVALHKTVEGYGWWLKKFQDFGCVVHWSRELEGVAQFYVTAWSTGQDVVDVGVLNVDIEQVRENVRRNIAGGWGQVIPHETNDTEVLILGGGPSMPGFEEEIRHRHAAGAKIVTLNGAYNWCAERGIGPVNQVVVDARPFNARFVQPVSEDNFYLIASQCDPSVLEGLPRHRTLLWHTTAEQIQEVLTEHLDYWFGVPGGSTVLLRAIPLLRMLGFKSFTLYGCDSCLTDGEHHAYSQPENEVDHVVPVTVGDRVFYCHPWMVAQATEWMTLVEKLGDEFEAEIRGDGLLAWIMEYAASMDDVSLPEKEVVR